MSMPNYKLRAVSRSSDLSQPNPSWNLKVFEILFFCLRFILCSITSKYLDQPTAPFNLRKPRFFSNKWALLHFGTVTFYWYTYPAPLFWEEMLQIFLEIHDQNFPIHRFWENLSNFGETCFPKRDVSIPQKSEVTFYFHCFQFSVSQTVGIYMSNNIPDRNCQTLQVSIWALLHHTKLIFGLFYNFCTEGYYGSFKL